MTWSEICKTGQVIKRSLTLPKLPTLKNGTHGKNRRTKDNITTPQPYFVDALSPEEVWVLEKGNDGFSNIRRASDDAMVGNMVNQGLPLGGLWYSDYLDTR